MVKTNSKKSVIALVVMAILLVLSMAMTITGAWFTDTASTTEKPLQFGTIEITGVTEDLAVSNQFDATVLLMPGSTLSGDLTIDYTGTAAAYIRYKVVLTGAGAQYVTNGVSAWKYDECAANTDKVIEISLSVSEDVGNEAQGLPVNVVIQVEAIQKANTAASAADAFARLEAAAD